MARRRLDSELVRRGLARSRDQAQELVSSGRVRVSGMTAAKSATQVDPAAPIVVDTDDGFDFVSRGGHKLAGAMAAFRPAGLTVSARRCLDAGASTGGFTQVLLAEGAASVLAVDVGYGQLAWSLRTDPRVTTLDRTNVRVLGPELVGDPVEVVVADLSFISLRLVLPALVSVARPDADFVLMVKPQFEVGRDRLGLGGVVKDPSLRAESVRRIAERAAELGLGVRGVTASPLPGPSGNVEYFLWLQAGAPPPDP
ncbi:MAG TPA: TlyA family RNA methyltransferase, partial [Actinomycetes bacterium]|nr:TlyA family RNA methyltransferase [Actinomycetes bacterium]